MRLDHAVAGSAIVIAVSLATASCAVGSWTHEGIDGGISQPSGETSADETSASPISSSTVSATGQDGTSEVEEGGFGSSDSSSGESTSVGDTSGTGGSPSDFGSSSTEDSAANEPADVLDLAAWKLTLPIAARDDANDPWEIVQPELESFAVDPWFMVDDAGLVQFRAHAGGVTTDGSAYPRSELREMTPDGADEAEWSTTEGVHTMTISLAVTQLPPEKPHVVVAQIHDADDDVVMIRLEGERLFVEADGDEVGDLDTDYQLGAAFTAVLSASDGNIEIFYEDLETPAVVIARSRTGCYFKAGAYTQSNENQGDAPDAYGEVVVSALVVEHG